MRLLATLLLACCILPAHADPAHDADVAAIRQVVQQFQAAIVAHDGTTLGALFLPDADSWLSVLDAPTWNAVRARNPAARKVMRSSWQKFADNIQHASKPVEEVFRDVRIETNGTVASVYFDFDFLADGNLNNRGSESWQLVHAEDGWKISSMLFSIDR